VVRAEGGGSQDASMWLYERSGGQWKIAAGPWPALVGRNGVSKRAEGDGKGPSGAFLLGTAFGWAKKPGGVLYQYRRLDGKDRWVDAASSPFYNRWVRGPAGACGSGETLIDIQQYKYAVAVHYNDGAEKGAGSAIFIHVWKGPETGTSGCTAVSEKNMVALLTWLDYSKRPVLLQGAEGELSLLMGEDWGMPSLPPGWGFADDFIPDAQIEAAPPAPMRMEAIEALAAVATEFRPRNIGLRMYSSEGTNGTIGLTLLGWKDGKDLDMSRPANRALLADAMRAHGFTPSDAGGQIFTFPAGGASGDFPSLAREHVIR
jgi:L,D-peptidoglycan transpeptidase YkuD (ErfK/YbiS/YcfS/YnhG family)